MSLAALPLDGSPPAGIETAEQDGAVRIALTGAWTVETIGRLERPLVQALERPGKALTLDLSRLERLDTGAAWVVYRAARDARKAGQEIEETGAGQASQQVLDRVAATDCTFPARPREGTAFEQLLMTLGTAAIGVMGRAVDILNFLGLTTIVTARALLQPRRLRVRAFFAHLESTGLNALPIVGLISFLIGVVLAYQGAEQLARFGAQIFTVNLVGIGVLREMGIMLTAIVVAGRSGSAFTAQIGTMKVNEEVDAIRTLGLDPMEVLVVPRVLALCVALPLLTFYSDIMGVLGGATMASLVLDISLSQFASQFQASIGVKEFWVGIVKAPLFAFVIAMIGCFEGLQVSSSAQSVGQHTTASVVEGIFMVIVLDAMLSIVFSMIGI